MLNTIRKAVGVSGAPGPLRKFVLNAGSGPSNARALHPFFAQEVWEEIRIDIDPQAKPDIVASITNLASSCAAQSFDAIWASHILEHLYGYEVAPALAEFKRILKPAGFALVTLPDLETVASLILDHGLDRVAYSSPAGPITPLDILFGHSGSIARGHTSMAHKTGFTCASLGQHFVDAGFPIAIVKRQGFDLWALGLMHEADQSRIQRELLVTGLDFFERQSD
jgi:SAM-dependent methyltransferase